MMMDDIESDEDEEETSDLTGFLFGNIDTKGNLEENDLFDEESKSHLHSLRKLGLGNILHDVVDSEDEERAQETDDRDEDDDEEDEDLPHRSKSHSKKDKGWQEDAKSPSAEDFFEMSELAEDESPAVEVISRYNDSVLMPPPAVLPCHISADDRRYSWKLNTPLAAMLPSKYAHLDVTDLFPEFRPNKVLRFSRLFGPGKPSSLPQIWRGVRKKRRKKRPSGSATDEHRHSSDGEEKEFRLHLASTPPREDYPSDDEEKFLHPLECPIGGSQGGDGKGKEEKGPKMAPWRFGPAQLWYDMLDVPETGDDFNYGFHLQQEGDNMEEENVPVFEMTEDGYPDREDEIPDEAYHMVSQVNWEDDVVWSGEDIKHKVLARLSSKTNAAGWVPSSMNRTAQTFSQPVKASSGGNFPLASGPTPIQGPQKHASLGKHLGDENDDTWYSIFPVENEELVYGRWEDEVIWDAQSMPYIPEPKVVTLDPNDENIILGIPDDVDPNSENPQDVHRPKTKIPHPHVRKSKLLLGKAGVITQIEEDSPPPTPKEADKDPFNISNDEFYLPKAEPSLKSSVGGTLIQHSTPVVELRAPFVPTHMGPLRLRAFHRPSVKRYSHGALAAPGPHTVASLTKEIKKKAKMREQERLASGGGDMFFMRTPEDLTGKDGEIILCEYSEEHPPLVMLVGMCTRIKNYYKRKVGKDQGPPEFKFGEVAYAHTSPFLGSMHPAQSIQTLENNMFRAPIYEHRNPPSDFLIIRTRHGYWIREVESLFTVGQECPLYEVPGPNSKRANNFVRDFLQVFIYRLFWKSKDMPRRIKMDDIKKAFPSHSESSIRKRLKLCADFKRTGTDSNWWVQRSEFRLPTEDELRAMVSPEQCCAYFSMIAAEQRLRDAGYGEKFLLVPQEDEDEDNQLKMDDEIKVAPWNTTRAYIQAAKAKCLLQLTGPADPTGCGEGFSYIRIPNKPQQNKEEIVQEKRTVTGTDADLRKLSLNNAKALLRKYGVPEDEINRLSRWEVIDVVRTLSTEKAKAGEEGMTKFSRGNRFSIAEHQERYKEECQRIFDLQNKVLASDEVLSTDEASSSEEDSSDIEEMGKNLENMLANKKTSSQLSREREEQERKELQRMLLEGGNQDNTNASQGEESSKRSKPKVEDDNSSIGSLTGPGKKLKIVRTFRNPEGKTYTRVEIVRHPAVMDAYVRIRTTKDENFIRGFAMLDEQQKEEMKREKRRLQEQLRRIKRNQERERMGKTPPTPRPNVSRRKAKLKPDLKMKCGACGQVGHMRTNKACPLYAGPTPLPPVPVAMTEDQEEELEKQVLEDIDKEGSSVNVDGTKVRFSNKIVKHAEELKRQSLMLKFPKATLNPKKKRRQLPQTETLDYLERHAKPANRRRIDPVVALSTVLESILNEMRAVKDVGPFLHPVNPKMVPDYFRIVRNPMDLQTMREKLHRREYQSREEFLQDVKRIVENSALYNGEKSQLTGSARNLLELCVRRFSEKEERLMKLEKAINPLLDDDSQVALTYILDNILSGKIKSMPESWPFLKPVNKKNVKDYYNVIQKPMDLEAIERNVKGHKYHTGSAFLGDIELIYENSRKYNGMDSPFTQKALAIYNVAKESLAQYEEYIGQLEVKIRAVQEEALDAAEMDSTSNLDEDASFRGAPSTPGGEEDYQLGLEDYEDDEEETTMDDYGDEDYEAARDPPRPASPMDLARDLHVSPEGSDAEDVEVPPRVKEEEDEDRDKLGTDLHVSESEDDEDERAGGIWF